jgi:gluconokinase
MDYFIGIDIGTGSTKAVALTTEGKVLHAEKVSYPTVTPQPQFSEQVPELIWQAFLKCIQRVVAYLHESPRGISLSTAMHSLIPVDEAGTPLMNMITWADNRSADIARRIKNSSTGEALYRQTGTPIHAMTPLSKIIWLRENTPELFQKTHKFISIKEYVWFKLFNTFEIDHSIATATGLFDIETLHWNETALNLCDIAAANLSVPVSTHYCRRDANPALAHQLQLAPGTPFIIGASDGCLANLGSFATEPGVAALTIGTSGAIRVANTVPTFNFRAMTFNYLLDEQTFISGGPINNGGVVLKWYVESFLKKKLMSPADYVEVLAELDHVPVGAGGLIFLPYLLGERAPLWNSEACGVFFGITPQHTQAHFTRAVIEGISMALYHISKALEESGLVINRVHVSGGFVHSHEWLQLMADIFGKPISLVNLEDASAIGAAYLAMKSLNVIANYATLKPELVTTFHPRDEHHRVYTERNFPLYQQLYKSLMVDMAVWHEMHEPATTAVNFAETSRAIDPSPNTFKV